MIIDRIETFLFSATPGTVLLFVKVSTRDGLYGWGEAYVGGGQPQAVAAHVTAMAEVLVGRNHLHIRQLGQALFDDVAIRQVSFDGQCAWSAIEIALWDILGKHAGLPVHQLLGGPMRSAIRAYANGWWIGAKNLDDVLARAVAVVGQGYDAIKWDPIPGPRQTFISREQEAEAVARLFALRAAVGPDVEIMVDGHRRLAPGIAIRLARRFAEAGISWYEEPCPPENLAETAQVRRATDSPVVVGEALCTPQQFLPVFAAGAADIVNPDICAVGGIGAMLDIASLARMHAVAVSPHNSNSTLVGLAATVHAAALMPNFVIAEVFVNLLEPCSAIAMQGSIPGAMPGLSIEGGWIALPEGPGLGVDIDMAALQATPARPRQARTLRRLDQEFPFRT